MVNPKVQEHVTLSDLLKCGMGGTVVTLLVDVQILIHNQNRE
jgi:hypothetical protein